MEHHPPPDDAFDPDAAALGEGLFGLPPRSDALIEVLPVPFEATTSYRTGTAGGPDAVIAASLQVDLHDSHFGDVWQAGIRLTATPPEIAAMSAQAASLARPIIERGGATEPDRETVCRVDQIGERLNEVVRSFASECLVRDRVPCLLGGEHSISLGAIQAACTAHPGLGVLQIDAHLDLRDRFEGFEFSHASVMRNALNSCEQLASITAVAIRDHGKQERSLAESDRRVVLFTDDDLAGHLAHGHAFAVWCDRIIESLPERVYVTLDVDGLEPSLCPSTGTPVPGGLTWQECSVLLAKLAESDKQVVAFDIVEVGTTQDIDAIVAARLLYRLCGVVRRQRDV